MFMLLLCQLRIGTVQAMPMFQSFETIAQIHRAVVVLAEPFELTEFLSILAR